MIIEKPKLGFIYTVEVVGPDGEVRETESCRNLIPNVGRDYLMAAGLMAGAQLANWYIGLYGNAYTPLHADTMTTLLAAAGELTSYTTTGGNRLALTPDELAGGMFANLVSPAEFVFPNGGTARGGFITSNALRGNNAGMLLSAALFPSPKVAANGETIRVKAGLQLIT